MGYKIRASQTQKVPYQLVVGDKEMEDATVNVRRYGSKETSVEDLSIFIDSMALKFTITAVKKRKSQKDF